MIYNALRLKKIQQATKLTSPAPHQAGNKIFFKIINNWMFF
jgi:hypothetical protein